jgi:hypothetical protein
MAYPVTGMGVRAVVLTFIGRALLVVAGLGLAVAGWRAMEASRWLEAATLGAAGGVALALFALSIARPRRAFIGAMLLCGIGAAAIFAAGLLPEGVPPALLLLPCVFWLGPIMTCEDPDGVYL